MKLIRNTIVAFALGGALMSAASGAVISLANHNGANSFFAVADPGGTAITAGSGFVTVGTFKTLDDAAIMNAGSSQASFDAMLADFVAFGSGNTFGGPGSFGSDGLYKFDDAGAIAGGDDFATKAIYTVATSGDGLVGATDVAVFKNVGTFGADAPLFTANANLIDGGTTVLLGTANNSITTLAGSVPGVNTVVAVPEPSAFLLSLAGVAIFFRRKR